MKLTSRVVASTVIAIAIVAVAAAFLLRPDRYEERLACEKTCAPRPGALVQNPKLSKSFKSGWSGGPQVCRCQWRVTSHEKCRIERQRA